MVLINMSQLQGSANVIYIYLFYFQFYGHNKLSRKQTIPRKKKQNYFLVLKVLYFFRSEIIVSSFILIV